MDADLIDPRHDRVWAVDVTVTYTTYVVAETADKANEIARDASGEDRELAATRDEYRAREIPEPVGDDGGIVAWGHSLWDGQHLTVNEAVELVAAHRPDYDTQTLLMPFVDSPPPIYPEPATDGLAARRRAR
jgi:hypothetical protein